MLIPAPKAPVGPLKQTPEHTSVMVAPQDRVALSTAVTAPDRHPARVYLARLAPGSRRTMAGALTTAAQLLAGPEATIDTLPWPLIRYQHTAALRAALWERYAPATANKLLAAVRGVLKEAWRLELMSAEVYHRAIDIGTVSGTRPQRGRALAAEELRAFIESCAADPSPAGVRDAALLAVLYGAGLRRAEAATLLRRHYTEREGALIVRGKRDKTRTVYLSTDAQSALADWLAIRGETPGPLFHPIRAGRSPGRLPARGTSSGQTRPVTIRPLTAEGIRKVLAARARAAGIAAFSPHDLRRSFISDLLDAGADLSAVQQLAGHASVVTTARYDRRGERAKKAAAARLTFPYRGR